MSTETNTQEIDLVELVKTIWGQRKMILKWCLWAALAGLIVAFSIPAEYTTVVKMAPENSKNTKTGGMSDLAAMAGINLGSASGIEGVNTTIYPDIIQTTPFLIEMSRIPVQGMKMDASLPLYNYIKEEISAPWWNYVLKAPMRLLGWTISLFKAKEPQGDGRIDPYRLTWEQSEVIRAIGNRMNVTVDKKSGMITASSTMQDALVSAAVCDSLTSKLQEYVAEYRTQKAKKDLEFTQKMFEDARAGYIEKQQIYAVYMDATQNVVLQSIRAEQERLRNEQLLAYTVYSQVTQQLEAAKIKVQEETPSVTVIEPATVPTRKSNTSKATILIVFVFLGGFIAAGTIVVKHLFLKEQQA